MENRRDDSGNFDQEPADQTRVEKVKVSFRDRLVHWLWGYDFFISYNQNSAGRYATNLAEQLRRDGFDVFLDTDDIAGGDALSETIVLALRRTQRMVVVCTKEVLSGESRWVAKEVLSFKGTGRQCIPVLFSNSFPDVNATYTETIAAIKILKSDENLRLKDSEENLQTGVPTQCM